MKKGVIHSFFKFLAAEMPGWNIIILTMVSSVPALLIIILFSFLDLLLRLLFGMGTFFIIFGLLLKQGLKTIKEEPPHKGLLTVLGERVPIIINEGLRIFPFYPWLYGFVEVGVKKANEDLKINSVITEDGTQIDIPTSITFIPEKTDGQGLITFLDSGGERGVLDIIKDIIDEELRSWALAKQWRDVLASKREESETLITQIAGLDDLNEQERKSETDAIRRGNGKRKIPYLGITLNRFNLGEMKVKGRMAEKIESQSIEAEERRAEVFEIETDAEKAKILMKVARDNKEEMTFDDAYSKVLEWKATREGHGFAIPGLSPTLTKALKMIFEERDKNIKVVKN